MSIRTNFGPQNPQIKIPQGGIDRKVPPKIAKNLKSKLMILELREWQKKLWRSMETYVCHQSRICRTFLSRNIGPRVISRAFSRSRAKIISAQRGPRISGLTANIGLHGVGTRFLGSIRPQFTYFRN